MYNKNMARRASKHDAPVSKGINKLALGFTIIETMLFLAIAGLIFAGLVAGTNGAIRRQRYKDSVQGFVDDLRDLYSLVENTQVLDYPYKVNCGGTASEGRGRSNCSVYGIYAIISPNHAGKENIEAYWVVGTDQSLIKGKTSDRDFFAANVSGSYAKVSTKILKDGGGYEFAKAKSHSILWGADVAIPCNSSYATEMVNNLPITAIQGCESGGKLSNDRNQVELFIYRSPITGSVNTMSGLTSAPSVNQGSTIENDTAFTNGVNLSSIISMTSLFNHYDVSLCITGGSGMSYDGGIRMVTIDGNGSNSNAVRLIEADSDENKCN